jgi:SAM-dependent methyltransferase
MAAENEPGLPTQSPESVAKNISFFAEHRDEYDKNVQQLDTYRAIRAGVDEAIRGVDRLLDIGNGGVFDYDTSIVKSIVALDLFLDKLPPSHSFPVNVAPRTGSALAIPEPDASFDGVLIVMLIHHLVGRTVEESLANVRLAVREAFRVLRPGGKLVIIESCVPAWFYAFERLVFPVASRVIELVSRHPATLQYPPSLLAGMIRREAASLEVLHIPKGRWVLQYGVKYPAVLTPVDPCRFVAVKG